MSVPYAFPHYAHWWLDRCFLYVGRMVEAKGVPQILDAWLRLALELGSGCPPLWLVGGSPGEIESMRKTADIARLSKYETEGRVKWWGYLDRAGISTVMLKTHVLVTHSLYEPGGRVTLEALAQGIPVIATPNGFAADLITDWCSGFLVEHGDVNALRTRMQHFALQPLLRHAMGPAAKRATSEALKQWNFLGRHLSVYASAASFHAPSVSQVVPQVGLVNPHRQAPRGFEGVYPFEGERIGASEVAAFLARHRGTIEDELAVFHENGRSRLWISKCNGHSWVIKHAFTTYRVRPMWDLGFGGSAVELQASRVRGEQLGSLCNDAAPVAAVDQQTGLILRDWLEPATDDSLTLEHCAEVISAFHRSTLTSINLHDTRAQLDRDWNRINDDEVVYEVYRLEASLRQESLPWHAWQPMSIRLAWRWLELGLRKKWLSVSGTMASELSALTKRESKIVNSRETDISFGVCHGDCDTTNFRLDSKEKLILIDCEHLHPGYFGHDWANLILSVLPNSSEDALFLTVKEAFGAIQPELCPRWLVFSWLQWITAKEICKALALMKEQDLANWSLRWRGLLRLASQIDVNP